MYPGLAEMERDLPAFIAHRVRKLQTSRRLIEEIDIQPKTAPRLPAGKLKTNAIRSVSPAVQVNINNWIFLFEISSLLQGEIKLKIIATSVEK